MATSTARQAIPIVPEPAFDAGHRDGYADAINGNPRDPAQRFQSWHRRRPVEQFGEYESAYVASWEQVRKSGAR